MHQVRRLRLPTKLCVLCGKEGQSRTFIDYERCEVCTAKSLEKTRKSKVCFRCLGRVQVLDARHLFCPSCGLVLAKDRDDVLKGADQQ